MWRLPQVRTSFKLYFLQRSRLLTVCTPWPLLRFYCADCLDKYGIKLSTVKGTPWVCLACEGLCTCKACLKVRVTYVPAFQTGSVLGL